VISTCFAWNDVVNVHLALIGATQLTSSAITHEHTLSLFAITPTVQLI
jgi:hypothetical protein